MRVLWLCNAPLIHSDRGVTGTWLGSMARELLNHKSIELGIIAIASVSHFVREDYKNVLQWLVPIGRPSTRTGLPSESVVNDIVKAVEQFAPDVIHIWGTEEYWGLLSVRGLLKYPSLLEIQGLKGEYSKVFYGGLTFMERLRCIGIKELIKRRTLHTDKHDFALWGTYEEEIIRGHRYIDVQSPWVIAHVAALNPTAQLFPVDLVLREPFYEKNCWQSSCLPTIFCTAAYSTPYKGLHVAIRAISLLKKRIPNIQLRIAGAHQRVGIRQDGYMRWINRLIKKLGLLNAIDWLGPLNAQQIAIELMSASAVVIPTFIETYCMAFAESMRVGAPTVISYVAGTPSLAKDEESCLYFSAGDVSMCAYQLERILTDPNLARRLSHEAKKIAVVRNDPLKIVQRQLEIYRQVAGLDK